MGLPTSGFALSHLLGSPGLYTQAIPSSLRDTGVTEVSASPGGPEPCQALGKDCCVHPRPHFEAPTSRLRLDWPNVPAPCNTMENRVISGWSARVVADELGYVGW